MANSNGRIFITTTGGVTYGVEIADLQQVLGRGVNDLGLLCSDQEWYDNNGVQALRPVNRINKWAKYKPIKVNTGTEPLGYLSNTLRQSLNWGLSISSTFRAIATLVSSYEGSYNYVHPDTIYRLTDFVKSTDGVSPVLNAGYYHGAMGFVYGYDASTNSTSHKDEYFIHHTVSGIEVTINWYRTSNDEEIGIGDLNLGVSSAINGYFGVVLVDETATTNKYRLICGTQQIGANQASALTIPGTIFTPVDADLTGHTFAIYPVISLGNENATGEGLVTDFVSWDLISLPDVEIYKFIVRDVATSISTTLTNLQSTITYNRQTASGTLSIRMNADLTTAVTLKVTLYGGATEQSATTQIKEEYFQNVSVSPTWNTFNLAWSASDFPSFYDAIRVTVEAPDITAWVLAEETATTVEL